MTMRDSANANVFFSLCVTCVSVVHGSYYNHGDIHICWHYRGCIFCHLSPGKEIKKKKEQETREAWHSRVAPVFSLGIIGQWFSTLSQVGNVSSYDKDSVCK